VLEHEQVQVTAAEPNVAVDGKHLQIEKWKRRKKCGIQNFSTKNLELSILDVQNRDVECPTSKIEHQHAVAIELTSFISICICGFRLT
jgi:alpha-acetolactate decarboxylase